MPVALEMSTTTDSVLSVARQALEVGRETFDDYAHPNSPRKFTQPQLFACLAVRQMLGTTYEATHIRLAEWSDLREVLELDQVPSSSALHEAQGRLLKKSPASISWIQQSIKPGSRG